MSVRHVHAAGQLQRNVRHWVIKRVRVRVRVRGKKYTTLGHHQKRPEQSALPVGTEELTALS